MQQRSESRERTVLVLQGGGALGAYQGGIYEALDRAGHRPDWVAGISIGAINAALIAGNAPAKRVERLHEFWQLISSSVTPFPLVEELMEGACNETAAFNTLMFGAPGFFKPRMPWPLGAMPGASAALSYYDTADLKSTLERLVDFDRINSTAPDRVRLSVGAVDIAEGNFVYFDSEKRDDPAKFPIRPEHVMASGALPPGLPPVPIGNGWYWDGGLVSNTPLQYVIDEDGPDDLLAFQVDLFPQKGRVPVNMLEAAEREKDIRYSSRTRLNTDITKRRMDVGAAAERLMEKLPPELRDDPDLAFLRNQACVTALTLVHFIYRSKHALSFSKDYEFSRLTVEAHWAAGRTDVETTLAKPAFLNRGPARRGEVRTFDLASPVAAASAAAKVGR